MSRRGREKDSKFLRLTGLWPSKHNDALYSGRVKNEDLEALQAKIEEAGDSDLVFFLWENKDKESRKDPEFTLQVAVSDGDGGRRKSRRDRDDDEDRGKSRRDRDEEEDKDEEEEEEKPRSKKGKGSKEDKDW